MDPDDVLRTFHAQLAAVAMLVSEGWTQEAAFDLCARLASLDPPVLLCHPDELKD